MNKRTGASRQSTPANGQVKAYLAGLVSGLFLAFLGSLLDINPKQIMGGEKKSLDKNNAKVETVRSGTKFDFYTVLPEQEVVIAEEQPVATSATGTATTVAPVPGTVPPPAVIEKTDAEKTAPITNLSAPAENAAAIKQAEQLAAQTATKPKTATYLQAGSFRRNEDADKRRAELLMYGFRAGVDSVNSNGEKWYRVQIGPFASDAELSRARTKLKANGIETMAMRRK